MCRLTEGVLLQYCILQYPVGALASAYNLLTLLSRNEVLGITECGHDMDITVQCSGKPQLLSHYSIHTRKSFNNNCVSADINECRNDPSPCDHTCNNTIGSFICSCFEGFRLNMKDNSTCNGE